MADITHYDRARASHHTEGLDAGLYLVIAGLLVMIAAFAFSALAHEENATLPTGLFLNHTDR